jgi:hypothetical protein
VNVLLAAEEKRRRDAGATKRWHTKTNTSQR